MTLPNAFDWSDEDIDGYNSLWIPYVLDSLYRLIIG